MTISSHRRDRSNPKCPVCFCNIFGRRSAQLSSQKGARVDEAESIEVNERKMKVSSSRVNTTRDRFHMHGLFFSQRNHQEPKSGSQACRGLKRAGLRRCPWFMGWGCPSPREPWLPASRANHRLFILLILVAINGNSVPYSDHHAVRYRSFRMTEFGWFTHTLRVATGIEILF